MNILEKLEEHKLKLENFEKNIPKTSNICNTALANMTNEYKQRAENIYNLLLEIKKKSDFIAEIKSGLEGATRDFKKGYFREVEKLLIEIIFLINTEQMR